MYVTSLALLTEQNVHVNEPFDSALESIIQILSSTFTTKAYSKFLLFTNLVRLCQGLLFCGWTVGGCEGYL